jgi:hypothetical protein
VLEVLIFIFSVSGLFAWAYFKDVRHERRDAIQARRMDKLIRDWEGRSTTDLNLGPPYEIIEGASGRSLHIWRCPPTQKLPRGNGILVVSLTVSPDGVIEKGEWKRWGI